MGTVYLGSPSTRTSIGTKRAQLRRSIDVAGGGNSFTLFCMLGIMMSAFLSREKSTFEALSQSKWRSKISYPIRLRGSRRMRSADLGFACIHSNAPYSDHWGRQIHLSDSQGGAARAVTAYCMQVDTISADSNMSQQETYLRGK